MAKILKRGSKGAEVFQLQRELKRQIVSTLGVDGDFGPDTEAAVRIFQESVGFRGKDVDGEVGPKTTLALCQTFDMKIWGHFRGHTAVAVPSVSVANKTLAPAKITPRPVPPAPPKPLSSAPAELPKTFTGNLQLGAQQAKRDSRGYQLLLGATIRSKDYFPHSDKARFYHGVHLEFMPSLTFGIPFPAGKLVTGQISLTLQPLTDWLVIKSRWHLLTPSLSLAGQIPLDPGESDKADPGTHSRLGGNLGLELFHFDWIPDKLSVGISGQESFYFDYTNHRVFYDPSVMAFLQWNFKSW